MAIQDTELMLDVGQANELKLAARRSGYTNADLKRLSEGDWMTRILPVLRGQAEVTVVKHVIDLDAAPLIPVSGWTVEDHQQGGQFEWSPERVSLHLSSNQEGNKTIEGNKLRKELAKVPVLNANLLDYLLKHPHLIPDAWKQNAAGQTLYIYFWGTIYRDSVGFLFVRYLCFGEGPWQADYRWLGLHWGVRFPAARLAS